MPTLALLAVMMAPAAGLPDDPPPPKRAIPPAQSKLSEAIKLRNAAAADVAAALNASLGEKDRANAVVVAEPVSNTVLVSAEPRLHRDLVQLIAKIDLPPQQVVIQAMVMEVRSGFLEDIGLIDDPKVTNLLTLTPREVNVLNMQIRHAKGRGEQMDILSRPQVQLADGQTGFVQTGQQFPYMSVSRPDGKGGTKETIEYYPIGVSMKVTPRFNPDGKVTMRVEPQVTTVAPSPVNLGNGIQAPAFNVQTMHSTVAAADGQTVVLHGLIVPGGAAMPNAGPFTNLLNTALPPARNEIVIVLTPHLVAAEKDKPKAEPAGRE